MTDDDRIAQEQIRQCIAEGYVWLDLDTEEVCEEEPDTPNKRYLPDFVAH